MKSHLTGLPRRRAAFTLVETIVVIGVIVVVAALLLPALTGAKSRAHRVDCISRQKQWAMGFLMYVEDHDGLIPREGYANLGDVTLNNWNQVKGISGESDDVWYNALAEYVNVAPAATNAPPNKRANFYHSSSLFHCPAAKIPPQVLKPFYHMAIFSIAMNSQLIEFPQGPTINFNRIRDEEARTVLFLDNLLEGEKTYPAQESTSLGQPAAYADRFSARHDNGGNLAFADGHVSWFPGKKVVETNPSSPLRGGAIMPPIDIVWEPKHDF